MTPLTWLPITDRELSAKVGDRTVTVIEGDATVGGWGVWVGSHFETRLPTLDLAKSFAADLAACGWDYAATCRLRGERGQA